MAAKKVCRVCGKEYEACRSTKVNPNIFRWQDVACSPECGTVYLNRVIESRKEPEVKTANADDAHYVKAENLAIDPTTEDNVGISDNDVI